MLGRYLLLLALIFVLAGCFQSKGDKLKKEIIQLGRCDYVGEITYVSPILMEKIDERLMRKAVSNRVKKLAAEYTFPNQNVKLEYARNLAASEVDNEYLAGSKVKKVLGWYESEYCQNVIMAYQDSVYGARNEDYEKNKKNAPEPLNYRTAIYLARDRAGDNLQGALCKDYREVYENLTQNTSLRPYRSLLIKSLETMILQSSGELKSYAQEAIKTAIHKDAQALGENIAASGIYRDIQSECSTTVRQRLGKIAQRMSSPVTEEIRLARAELENNPRFCGDFGQYYCLSDLKSEALSEVEVRSMNCDKSVHQSADCENFQYAQIYEDQIRKKELEKLQRIINSLSLSIVDPERQRGNAYAYFQDSLEECKREAIRLKYSNKDYRDNVELYCKPKAKMDYTKPQQDRLDTIIRRVKHLQQDDSSEEPMYGMSLALARLVPSSFVRACMEQEAGKIEVSMPTRIEAYRRVLPVCLKHLEDIK